MLEAIKNIGKDSEDLLKLCGAWRGGVLRNSEGSVRGRTLGKLATQTPPLLLSLSVYMLWFYMRKLIMDIPALSIKSELGEFTRF